MSKVIIDDDSLTGIADEIRSKGGTSAKLSFPDGMISAINDLDLTSTFESKVVTIGGSDQEYIDIPISKLYDFQLIHICLLDEDMIDAVRVRTLTVILSSNNAVSRCSIVSYNDYDTSNYVYWNPQQSGGITFSASESNVTISLKDSAFGCFRGRYSCELFGI